MYSPVDCCHQVPPEVNRLNYKALDALIDSGGSSPIVDVSRELRTSIGGVAGVRQMLTNLNLLVAALGDSEPARRSFLSHISEMRDIISETLPIIEEDDGATSRFSSKLRVEHVCRAYCAAAEAAEVVSEDFALTWLAEWVGHL